MKKFLTLISAAIGVLAVSTLLADTLELADGELLEGRFIGSSNGVIMFDTGGGIEAFQESEVVGLFFSSGVATAESLVNASQQSRVTVPAGTRRASSAVTWPWPQPTSRIRSSPASSSFRSNSSAQPRCADE